MIKSGPQGETAYVNQFYVVRNGAVATKHIFAGGSRLASKLASQPDEFGKVVHRLQVGFFSQFYARKRKGFPAGLGGRAFKI